MITDIFDELIETSEQAIDRTLSALPKAFPQRLAGSIVKGLQRRLASVKDEARRN